VSDRSKGAAALGVDPLDAQIRQVYFFDTPELTLNKSGLVVRARRVQRKGDDSVVKAAHLDDDGMLFPERELDLLARRTDQWAALLPVVASVSAPIRSSTWSPTLSEFAIAVSAGLTAPMLGKTLVSTT
jgi:hypothetical protein